LAEKKNPLLHEHLAKMAVFIEKPLVTSSNCYETIKKGFNTVQTWHKC
jgi:hypothetical protein